MKKLLIVLTILAFVGCNRPPKNIETITRKSMITNNWSQDLPNCICYFSTSYGNNFEDSCHFYSYGDTIR